MLSLSSIQKNAAKPPRIIIHGEPGIGKTTFGALAPRPIFMRTEDGLGMIDVPSFPITTSFTEAMEAVNALQNEQHEFATLVIDSLDWLEPLIWDHVCATWVDGKGQSKRLASIEDAGYGKGYVEAIGYWRQFLAAITALRDQKNMIIIMIAHSAKVRIEDPTLPAYDKFDLKLHKKAAAICGEYADIILFAQQHSAVTKEGQGFNERVRAISNGKRIIHTVGQPSFLAKNRFNLPAQLPLSWEDFSFSMWST